MTSCALMVSNWRESDVVPQFLKSSHSVLISSKLMIAGVKWSARVIDAPHQKAVKNLANFSCQIH